MHTPEHGVVDSVVVTGVVIVVVEVVDICWHSQHRSFGFTNTHPGGQVVILQILPHLFSPFTHLHTWHLSGCIGLHLHSGFGTQAVPLSKRPSGQPHTIC